MVFACESAGGSLGFRHNSSLHPTDPKTRKTNLLSSPFAPAPLLTDRCYLTPGAPIIPFILAR
jgi:hypothetical protein